MAFRFRESRGPPSEEVVGRIEEALRARHEKAQPGGIPKARALCLMLWKELDHLAPPVLSWFATHLDVVPIQ